MNTPMTLTLAFCLTGVVLLVTALTLGLFADITATLSIRRQVSLENHPYASEGISDETIIKLANDGLREEAARLYVASHGGGLSHARFIVGSGKESRRLLLILGALCLSFILIALVATERKIPLATIWLANIILFSAFWMKARHLIANNRKTLAGGRMPRHGA